LKKFQETTLNDVLGWHKTILRTTLSHFKDKCETIPSVVPRQPLIAPIRFCKTTWNATFGQLYIALKDLLLVLFKTSMLDPKPCSHKPTWFKPIGGGGVEPQLTMAWPQTPPLTRSQVTGWNPLEGLTKSSCGKLRLGGTLPASNSRKG
jgi:hypothetical protein